MNRKTDVLVIGSGMAGLSAALAAANRGCKVGVVSEGMGCLAISGGCIDLLGYDASGKLLDNPWEGFDALPKNHPYKLLGKENVEKALNELCQCLEAAGLKMQSAKDSAGNPKNMLLPTIMGTLKPTWLFQDDVNPETLASAKRILVLGVKGFRDFRPKLIISQLKRYPEWAEREFEALVLPEPFNEGARSLNALDLAHVGERKDGKAWLLDKVRDRGKNFDLAIIPPLLGVKANSEIRKLFPEALGCPCVELQSIPPGVAGMRLRSGLLEKLHDLGVDFYENAQIAETEVKDGRCVSLAITSSGNSFVHHPGSVVVATGGIISGGLVLGEGTARESIFGIELKVPQNVDDWTEKDIFGRHFLTSLGLEVNDKMQLAGDSMRLDNVFFAGRTLGGYDYASEKSGHGVACATGWRAGCMAAETAKTTGTDGVAK